MCSLTSIIFHSHARGLVTSLVIVFPFFFSFALSQIADFCESGPLPFFFFPFSNKTCFPLQKRLHSCSYSHLFSQGSTDAHTALWKKSQLRPRCHFFRSEKTISDDQPCKSWNYARWFGHLSVSFCSRLYLCRECVPTCWKINKEMKGRGGQKQNPEEGSDR